MQDGHSLLIFSANTMHARQNRWPHGVVAVALPASSLKQIGHSGGMSLGCLLRMCLGRTFLNFTVNLNLNKKL